MSLTADPGVTSSIPALSNTFVEIDHEIIYMVVLLPSAESIKKCVSYKQKVVPKFASKGYPFKNIFDFTTTRD